MQHNRADVSRIATDPPLNSTCSLPDLWVVPHHRCAPQALWHAVSCHDMCCVPRPGSHHVPEQRKDCAAVSKAQKVTLVCKRAAQAVSDGILQFTHPSAPSAPAGLPLLPVPAGSHLRPNVTLILVQAAPSEISQLPVHAKRHLSLILGDGLTLFQKVLPCCAFGFCYLTW